MEKMFVDCSLLPCQNAPKFRGENFRKQPQNRESFLPWSFPAIWYIRSHWKWNGGNLHGNNMVGQDCIRNENTSQVVPPLHTVLNHASTKACVWGKCLKTISNHIRECCQQTLCSILSFPSWETPKGVHCPSNIDRKCQWRCNIPEI